MLRSLALCSLFLLSRTWLPGATQPELWYFQHSYLNSPAAVTYVENIVDQAVTAGYTGIVLWDTGITVLQYSWWNPSYMQQVIQYAQAKGLKVMPLVAPYGHSTDILRRNPNWAEGEQVVGTQLQVNADGKTMHVVNSLAPLVNASFESGKTGWFAYGDAGTTLDYSTAHTGSASGLISGALNPNSNARFYQNFAVKPWRQYHLRMYLKTQNFAGYTQMEVFGDNNFDYNRVNQALNLPANQDWTAWDYTFNSGNHTTMSILTGVWGGNQGNVWFDDITVEETALVYVERGSSTPLSVYDPGNPSHLYSEGVDYGNISEPKFATNPTFDDYWHAPMTVTVPAGSGLKPGQMVSMDWYAIQPVYGDAGVSLTDPGAWQWQQDNAKAVGNIFPNAAGYLFGYDEMRHLNSTASAKAKNMTAGQLLAWNFRQVYDLYKSVNPNVPVYVWSDMFDPNHNAVNNFYLAEGDISGSWLGVPADVTIVNWNLGGLTKSATWFSGLNPAQPVAYQQIVAGFYDTGNGGNAASAEIAQIKGIPGIKGFMYTTFADDYSQLASFATAVKAGWSAVTPTPTPAPAPGPSPAPAPTPTPTPAGQSSATFVKMDTVTQGNWKGTYGRDGSAIVGDSVQYPPYSRVTVSNQNTYTWANSTTDPRALMKISQGSIAGTWFSNGFTIDVALSDGNAHQVGLYGLDWDNLNRAERIDVVDSASGALLDSRSLSAFRGGDYLIWNVTGHVRFVVSLTAGENAVISGLFFDPLPAAVPSFALATSATSQSVTGGGSVTYPIVISASGTSSTVVLSASGIPPGVNATFSPASIAGSGTSNLTLTTQPATLAGSYNVVATGTSGSMTQSLPLQFTVNGSHATTANFVKTDMATAGDWSGAYGRDGAIIAAGVSQPAPYAQVTMSNQNLYTWTSSTVDSRALQNSTGRAASTWFSNVFTIDVNITDGNTHQLGLYCLDWDSLNRSQRIDIVDTATGAVLDSRTVSAFSGGQYLVWNVSGHVTARVNVLTGANAVVSGLFLN